MHSALDRHRRISKGYLRFSFNPASTSPALAPAWQSPWCTACTPARSGEQRTNPGARMVQCGKLTFRGLSATERVTLDTVLVSGCPWWHHLVALTGCPAPRQRPLCSWEKQWTSSSSLWRRNSDLPFCTSFLSAWPFSIAGSAHRTCCAAGERCLLLLQLWLTNTFTQHVKIILEAPEVTKIEAVNADSWLQVSTAQRLLQGL